MTLIEELGFFCFVFLYQTEMYFRTKVKLKMLCWVFWKNDEKVMTWPTHYLCLQMYHQKVPQTFSDLENSLFIKFPSPLAPSVFI